MSSPRFTSRRAEGSKEVYRLDVVTQQGVARGVRERGIETWRGLPYALPPVGGWRFRAPQPPRGWEGVRDASRFGAVAPQSREGNFIGAAKNAPMGEDCLTLNVVRPAGSGDPESAALLPVMVFIHGGAYSVGSSSEVPRNGDTLARDGQVVYVSLNYRLGALGFLDFTAYSTPERVIENNLGLRDCVAALEWVQANIRSFGGDPERVTLFGESAGANAVTTLMTVPRASGLFARAIAQSSPTNAVYPPTLTREWAAEYVELLSERVANDSVENTSAEDAGELLATADWRDLIRATDVLTMRAPDTDPGTIALCPVIDGDFLPERPLDAFKAGRAHPVPLIIGTNDREGSLFTGRLDILATTPKRIRAIFAKTKKKARKAIKAEYPGLPAKRPAADFGGDYAFWYPTVKVAERHARYAPVYFYRFDIAPRLVRLAGFDATHGLELFALFDRMGGSFGRTMTLLGGRGSFLAAGGRMREYWVWFAYTGSVNPVGAEGEDARGSGKGSATIPWPRYSAKTRRTLIFDGTDRVESDPRSSRRLAWQAFVPHV
ncbi:carboxylesterase/lipase family protein [Subtercola boreus]|uniref:Carboxylic ester hydrolase n=1 Tax=Subtercola boreus TaxID=120213 RepID=A0A3E0W878_9MICO|nr:carboxylesterase/lipase family protein [Subtercola boreus]RFA18240.1 carboxylesterase [Subtercola boreus]RFA18632.1 carboxylesterase [Subtercola boreus]RFA25236.1 carboxylesterase [Subtercola boreus]